MSGDGSRDIAAQLQHYLERLFPICRSITGAGNRETLAILREIVPLTVHEVPSGTPVFDWIVPDEWSIRDAWIAAPGGDRIVDFRASNLHVVSYSVPVRRTMSWAELEPHLHVHPALPDAIPYRTTYYRRDWGFCVTHAQRDRLRAIDGPLEVVVDSTLAPGSLTYGEYLVPGRSAHEVLISCYICHPSMANDSLSGVLLTAFLARTIAARADRHWSYRVVFVPETIGAIAYCAANEDAMRRIDMGLVVTTVGGPGPFGYKQSWRRDHAINAMTEQTFRDAGVEFVTYPFDPHGSDERQYSSPGFRINTVTISKDRYYEYPQYHSSKDDLSFVTGARIGESLALYERLVDRIERRTVYRSLLPNCEPMLGRHGLYPTSGGTQRPMLHGRSELDLTLWLLHLADGRLSVDEIADRLGVAPAACDEVFDRLRAAGLVEAL